ncbi:MAG: flagellar hook-length control protein FliK [Burkholderiaceae bacterium]
MAIKNDMSRADIRITPNELGPISIELTVEGNTASVSFAAESSQTRNALQDSLSFLRDQLAREGLTLGEASVGEQPNHAFNQRGDDHPTDEWTAVAGETADPLSDTTLPTGYRPSPSGQGLVDLFA